MALKKNRFLRIPAVLPLRTKGLYQEVPSHDLGSATSGTPFSDASPFGSPPFTPISWRGPKSRWRKGLRRLTVRRAFGFSAALALIVFLIVNGVQRRSRRIEREEAEEREKNRPKYHWEHFPRLNGYYNGVRSLIKLSRWLPEQEANSQTNITIHDHVPMNPVMADPYHFSSAKYLEDHHPVNPCYLDDANQIPAPEVFAFPGVPDNMTEPYWGSYDEINVTPDLCWERFGRLGPYGYSYTKSQGGLDLSKNSDYTGTDKILDLFDPVDYRVVDWGKAQKTCFEKNKHRFDAPPKPTTNDQAPKKQQTRTAYVLRTWTGYRYDDIQLLSLRAMINELSLKSGGEYDVHLLVHVKDESIPIWASDEIYQDTLRKHVPKEFWGIATLWSVPLMRLYYPGFTSKDETFDSPSGGDIYGVYRSAHFPLQWFSQQHQEYDFVWNWEMDVRYTGHYYEFHNGVGEWADRQPRKLLWERSQRFWIPALHGSFENFTNMVEKEVKESGEAPVWGPVKFPTSGKEQIPSPNGTEPPTSFDEDNYEWGVGEPADLITFNPYFDPSKTNWVFRNDVTGYNKSLEIPPRRSAIITIARMSRRLLNTMHQETYHTHHSMFAEMFPPTVAFHHGLKAVYAPHPVYFDRKWPLDTMDVTFNHPDSPTASPFGWGEHNMLGGSFYYNSGFSGALWRRWLGAVENGEGGRKFEEDNSGRMCLRPLLHHPIKWEKVE
ncbi:hypothetical protein BKA67DRAFT_527311 [Truncatella angustata]|uniref:Major facilitator superfamily transporter n=1 Tax=Truncatella angustata TaxID=152316 RepID=A0A9P8RGB8_9PEZI|nr:uncharacterized protein BKA67DRAFT_527311 [Truncatella angustata]KAH6645474.1 hypothetical protein BKA67DRAFT_527311 [Truncatella angustata]